MARRFAHVLVVAAALGLASSFPARAFADGPVPQSAPTRPRPRVGVALGGGSARGIAHVGLLRWFDEHHIPIDTLAGTSMGALIGGCFAAGMTPQEIEALLASIDWDVMFSGSDFPFQNVRRKRDSREFPSSIELGLKKGLGIQSSLNSGQRVDLLLQRVAAPYYGVTTFDDLPTPFRTVAFDLVTAKRVVLDRGPLSLAMRASMSLPAIFPPVASGPQWLVDGGTVDNIPADVVRDQGADFVIAVNVGDLSDQQELALTMFGVAGATLDAMMRANTLKGLTASNLTIDIPLKKFGSLDWRRSPALIAAGYAAAEAMKDTLLPLALNDADWSAWLAARAAKTRRTLPNPAFVEIRGAGEADTAVMQKALAAHVAIPLDLLALENTIIELGGIGRYETLRWQIVERDGRAGILVEASPKPYGPPFLLFGVSLENTTSDTFHFGLSGRYITFDKVGSGSEVRISGAVGSTPGTSIGLYRPLWRTPFFVDGVAGIEATTLEAIVDNQALLTYQQTSMALGADAGVNLGHVDEVRTGGSWGRATSTVRVGVPLPDITGKRTEAHAFWTHDSQDSPVIASRGIHGTVLLQHFFTLPEPPIDLGRQTRDVTQLSGLGSWVRSLDRNTVNRVFLNGGAGTSFGAHSIAQFRLGGPLRLSAFNVDEKRGDHFILATGGYFRKIARLPDFIGRSVLAGGWLEEGSAFNRWNEAQFETQLSAGLIAETVIGPAFVGVSVGADGSSRFYLGIGKILR